ncbi:MAG: flippase-like domain-containing protein [Proteobacteria bacterium]|nr:flippase-like domain-containing protein [Pseudomonadota bacterium]
MKIVKRGLAVAFTLAFVFWLLDKQQWTDLAAMLEHLPGSALGLAAAGFFLSYLLRAARVFDEFRHEADGRFGACLRIVLMHNAAVNIVPFRGGEAAFPILLGKLFGTPLTRALASLFWFRLQDALVVAVLAVAVWPGLPLALRLAGVAALILFAWALPRWARRPHSSSPESRFARLRDAFAKSTQHARYGWFWTIANWSVKLAAQAYLLAALIGTSLNTGAAGALGAELAAILPVQGVAGFGTYEAGAAAALLPNGIMLADGLRAALALHLFVIACSVCAGIIAALLPEIQPTHPTAEPTESKK